MVVNFDNIDLHDRPTLILRDTLDTPIGYIGAAIDVSLALKYNDVSELRFTIPYSVDGEALPYYGLVRATAIVELKDVGKFIISEPSTESDGVVQKKSCVAYSLEREWAFRNISVEDDTYNFHDPITYSNSSRDNGTILGIVMSKMPGWTLGSVSASLVGKYRTFSENETNLYSFVKGTLQETYGCVFTFNTMTRSVNVIDAYNEAPTSAIYLSTLNLLKQVTVNENVDNLVTCLNVTGADGVGISSVNPLANDKMYNFTWFLDHGAPQSFVSAYNAWQTLLEADSVPFYNLSVERAIQTGKILTMNAELVRCQDDLSSLYLLQSVNIEAQASGINRSDILSRLKNRIALALDSVDQMKDLIANEVEYKNSLTSEMQAIVDECSIEANFTGDNLTLFNSYVRDGSHENTNFVVADVNAAASPIGSAWPTDVVGVSVSGSSAEAFVSHEGSAYEKDIARLRGGNASISFTSNSVPIQIAAPVISGAVERKSDGGEMTAAFYFGAGTITRDGVQTRFTGGCFSACGTGGSNALAAISDGTGSFDIDDASAYFTGDTTEYAKYSVELDLYEYGKGILDQMASPTYEFSADSANFLAIEEFDTFKSELSLGQKVYLNLPDGMQITPIVIGVEVSWDDVSKMSISFSTKFTSFDSEFKVVDLLEQSVSMGRTVDFSKYSWNDYISSGDKASLTTFINSAFDVAKNTITASDGQDVSWDSAGIHLRKAASGGGYEDEQVRLMNRMIAFTDDGWSSVKVALGHYQDTAAGIDSWGLVADNVVGHMIAGQNLIISGTDASGTDTLFRVDSNGAMLKNGTFDIIDAASGGGLISLNGEYGLVAGPNTSVATDEDGNKGVLTSGNEIITKIADLASGDEIVPSLWFDMTGAGYFKGTVYADNGMFSGIVRATDFQTADGTSMLTDSGKWDSSFLDLGNIILDGETGRVTIGPQDGDKIIIDSNGIQMDGSDIKLYGGNFHILDDSRATTYGYIGLGYGHNGHEATAGIVMSQGSPGTAVNPLSDDDYYFICTDSGVRMNAASNSIYVTSLGAFYKVNGTAYPLGIARFGA